MCRIWRNVQRIYAAYSIFMQHIFSHIFGIISRLILHNFDIFDFNLFCAAKIFNGFKTTLDKGNAEKCDCIF